jgi:flagellar hook-basal body complex protein FliE
MSADSTISACELLYRMRALAAQIEGGSEGPAAGGPQTDFSAVLKQSLDQVAEAQRTSSQLGQAFEAGDPSVSVGDLMVAMQKSSLSFQAALQVRNKLVSAYQEVMSMQV